MTMINDRVILKEIDILKGIAITCVVLYHSYPSSPEAIVWGYIRDIITLFQMPAFMFASGYLYGFSGIEINSKSDYYGFIKKKFRRLMIPYLTVSLIILLTKYFGGFFATLQNPIDRDFWKYILFNPGGGFANYLWFIYVLFIIFLMFPLVKNIVKNPYILLICIIMLYFINLPAYFHLNLDLVQTHFIFFYLGYLYSKNKESRILVSLEHIGIIFILAFIIEYILIKLFYPYSGYVIITLSKRLSLGILGVLSLYYISFFISKNTTALARMLRYLGISSVAIYLFHTVPIGTVKIYLLQYLKLSDDLSNIVVTLMFISGMVVPILILKYILMKNRTLSLMILGK